MHHRTPNKSLRHVGKLNEGYLSDVHTSFSNLQYDSDASSDLMESTKVLEKQFKDKYRVLRGAYERRIEQLTTSVEAVCARILGDDLIASMRTDAASSVFIPAHISETLASYLKGDRESDIQDLLERESALNIQLTRKNAIIDNQNARLAELEKDTTKGKSSEGELEALQEKVKSLEAQYSAYSQHAKEEMDELRRQSETETNLRKSLQEQYDKSQGELSTKKIELERLKADNGIKLREVFELEKSIQLTGRDMSHLSEAESRLKMELDQYTQKLKRVEDHRDSLAADVQRLTEKLRYSSEDLEKAQASQEILLREKNKSQQTVDDAVAKTKRIMTEEVEQLKDDLNFANKKIKTLIEKFELDVEREKHATQTYKDEAAISKAIVEEKQKEIRSMAADAANAREQFDNLREKLTNVREILEETNVQLLRTKNTSKEWQSRAYEAETRINEMSFAYKKEKKLLEEQMVSEMEKQMEAERKQLESKSDVFRMHYQNQLLDLDISRTNMSLSRSMAAAPRVDVRHSGVFDRESGVHNHNDHSFQSQSQVRPPHHFQQLHSQSNPQPASDHYLVEQVQKLQHDNKDLHQQLEGTREESNNLQLKLHRLQHDMQIQQQRRSADAEVSAPNADVFIELEKVRQDYQILQRNYESKRLEASKFEVKLQQLQQQQQHKQHEQRLQQRPRHQEQEQEKEKERNFHEESKTLDIENTAQFNQLAEEYEELQQQYEIERQEVRALQMKLQQAADTIEKLKDMVSDAHSVSDSQKRLIQNQKDIIFELENVNDASVCHSSVQPPLETAMTSPTSDSVETQVVGITRVRKLEAEIVKLQTALSEAQAQAREDHEQDSILLESMQQKFETLVGNYEASRNEQNESIVEQEGIVASLEDEISSQKNVISMHENTIADLQQQVKSMVDFNRQLEMTHADELTSLKNEAEGLKSDLITKNDLIEKQEQQLKATQFDLDKHITESQKCGDNLLVERQELKSLRRKNQKLNEIVFKIDDTYRLQIRELRIALNRVKDNVVVLERSVESEAESIYHKTEAFARPLFDAIDKRYAVKMEAERQRLTSAHMREEKHLIGSLKKRLDKDVVDENDSSSINSLKSQESSNSNSTSNSSAIVDHYQRVLKSIFEALSSSSIIDTDASRNLIFYLDSANIKKISEQQVGEKNSNTIGVVAAKLYEMLSRELNKYVKEKERVTAQMELMSDMLRKEKLLSSELNMSLQHSQSKKYISNNQSVSTRGSSFENGTSDSQIRKLEAYIEELKLRHKMEIDRLKLQWEKDEGSHLKQLESKLEESEKLRTDLENKLRTEQTRRHHLQSRLVSEEAEHRAELEDFEKRFFDLQRRFASSQK